MIAICKLKMDDRGRVIFPSSFLKANNLTKATHISVYPVGGRDDAVRLEFDMPNPKYEEIE